MNKFQFIKQLLDTKKFSPSQKERFFKLVSTELADIGNHNQEILEDIRLIKERIGMGEKLEGGYINKSPTIQMLHSPRFVSNYLKQFKENTDLKWTTHVWDNIKYKSIDDFITGLNNSKEYSSLFKYNINLYNLINYFIYNPREELNDKGVPKFGWPNLHEMKFGWQYPNKLLIDWCKQNYDNRSFEERKKPFQYLLPIELRPKKTVKGKEIKYFEDVVDVFKTEIQFREEYLYKELRRRSRSMVDFNFIGIDEAKQLNFYTYTPGVLSAIDHIFEQIKKNETAREIRFSFKESKDKLIISISQINSFPIKKELNPDNPKAFVGGQLFAIAESLFSLADFSVESKFKYKGREHFGELFITYDGMEGEMYKQNITLIKPPKFIPFNGVNQDALGFVYKLSFYI